MSYHEPENNLDEVDRLDDLGRAKQTLWRNVGCGAFVTGVLGFFGLFGAEADAQRPLSIPTVVGFLLGSVVVGGILGAALTMKDVVAAKKARRQRIGCFPKLLFGAGLFSVVIWGVIISIGTTIIVVIATRLFG